MVEALVFGVIASGALVIGSAVGVRFTLKKQLLAGLLAFAAGSLITALAFELFEDSYEAGGVWRSGLALVAGAVVFVSVSYWLDRRVAGGREGDRGSPKLDKEAATSDSGPSASGAGSAAGLALLAAVTLDGVPENLALGVSLSGESGGLVLLVAIFMSNFPESLVGAASMKEQGRSTAFTIGTWTAAAVLLTVAVVVGQGLLSQASPETVSIPLAFAGGAVIASLADTLMPEAFERGGPLVALSTTAGFLISFLLSTV